MNAYVQRIADSELTHALQRAGAVLIDGPRACGKTETAKQHSASVVHLDRDPASVQLAQINPSLVLEGEAPRLLDEWQLAPELWNAVRGEVDSRQAKGQFILTGSTAPQAEASRHSGAGRIARVRMRTMTLYELGRSSATVSLQQLMLGEPVAAASESLGYKELTEILVRGGWPAFREDSATDASANLIDYLETITNVDLEAVDGVNRDPIRVRRLINALARSTATEVTISTLARDETSLSRDAVREYLAVLERVFVIENQPAWSTHLRTSATLRSEPKRHFADPSLAAAALHAGPERLQREPGFTGQLFESLVVHDLRVFSAAQRGIVSHARDSVGREIDAIVQVPDGTWAGFEVKLASTPDVIDQAATGLLNFAEQVTHPPASLNVVVPEGASYRRPDGVNVVAFAALGP